jgi:drug/metabolite transporter (DMT)-like permease
MISALLSAFMFAFNNILWKQKLIEVKTNTLISYRAIFTSSIAIVLTLILCESFTFNVLDFIKISSGSIMGFIGLWCMLIVIRNTSLQWLAVYNLVGVVLNAVYLIVFESYDLTSLIIGGIFIVFGFIHFVLNQQKSGKSISLRNHLILTIMTISFSLSSIIHWKNLSSDISPLLIISNQETIVLFFSTFGVIIRREKDYYIQKFNKHFKSTFFMAIILVLALFFSLIGLEKTNPLTMSLVVLISPILTLILNSILLKDRISNACILSVIFILFGSILLEIG